MTLCGKKIILFLFVFSYTSKAEIILDTWVPLCDHQWEWDECKDFCVSTNPSRNHSYRVFEDGDEFDNADVKCQLDAFNYDPSFTGRVVHIYSQAQNDCLNKHLQVSKYNNIIALS